MITRIQYFIIKILNIQIFESNQKILLNNWQYTIIHPIYDFKFHLKFSTKNDLIYKLPYISNYLIFILKSDKFKS